MAGQPLDETDVAFISTIVPPGMLPLGVVAMCPYLDPDGRVRWRFYYNVVGQVDVTLIGILEKMQHQLLHVTDEDI